AKSFGCAVREVGIILLVFIPVPYVDASASSALPDRWQRMAVAAAGVAVELMLAAIATHVWASTESRFWRAAAVHVMLVGGVSTVFVNGNPLLRFDGYYVLIDLIGVPNLASRAQKYWSHLVDHRVFGSDLSRPFPATRTERAWMLVYAPAAFAYRLMMLAGIS